MKRSIFLLAVIFSMSLSAAYAQTDSTHIKADPTKEMMKITSADLPQPIQDALSSSSYTGWEAGEIYRSENSDKYVIKSGDATTPKYYYFDKDGKPMNDKIEMPIEK